MRILGVDTIHGDLRGKCLRFGTLVRSLQSQTNFFFSFKKEKWKALAIQTTVYVSQAICIGLVTLNCVEKLEGKAS